MYREGVLEVHDNVVFEANTATDDGGAVSLPLSCGSHISCLVSCDGFREGWFDLLGEFTKPH
jgi:hypothetical protein